MTRINLFRNTPIRSTPATADSVAWGKINFEKTTGAVVFAALLIICSIAVGCSSDSPKPVNSSSLSSPNQNPPAPQTLASSQAPMAETPKPAPKKVVKKRPTTATYVDKTYGVSFEYPRRYAIETGDAAKDVLESTPLPMNFALPGGIALAVVELPETGFANTDFSSAFFNVSVNKAITAEDCGKFSVPQSATTAQAATPSSPASPAPAPATPVDSTAPATPPQTASAPNAPEATASDQAKVDVAKADSAKPAETSSSDAKPATPAEASNTAPASTTPAAPVAPAPKVMLSDMEMQKIEAVSGEGNRQSDSKYFHVYQNGACYEFTMNVTTVASQVDGEMKHVDREKVFQRLEKIMATVKISPLEAEKEVAGAPAAQATGSATPAQ